MVHDTHQIVHLNDIWASCLEDYPHKRKFDQIVCRKEWHNAGKLGLKNGFCRKQRTLRSRGGGYSIYPWVGRCGTAPHTLTLFKTNIADFPTLFKTEFRFLIPCLRHLTRNHTLCKTIINIETLSYLIHWQSQNYLQLFKTKIDKIDTLFKTKIPKKIPWLAARPH